MRIVVSPSPDEGGGSIPGVGVGGCELPPPNEAWAGTAAASDTDSNNDISQWRIGTPRERPNGPVRTKMDFGFWNGPARFARSFGRRAESGRRARPETAQRLSVPVRLRGRGDDS